MKRILAVVLPVFDFTLFLAMRSIWSGIEGMFGVSWLSYLLFAVLTTLAFSGCLVAVLRPQARGWLLGFAIAGGILALPLFYMLYLGIGSLHYILRSFGYILGWLVVLDFAIFLIFYYPHSKMAKTRWFQAGLFGLLLTTIVILTFNLRILSITAHPVVYAVEDEYQIVWTTSVNATGEVQIGGTTYSDLYAGSLNSETTVHKVIVPMDVLDGAESYSIRSRQILYRGPYSGVYGGTVSEIYDFYPVDVSDGLNYYTLSDSHEYLRSATATGSYFGEELDFLILAGDIASHLEESADIELILELAHGITHGSHPVIYARGNHETKGDVAPLLHRYVGSKDEKFFYTVSLGPVFMVVLDLGEDHPDDWWEYYGTAHFDEYRDEQTEFLEDTIASLSTWRASIQYRIGVCHIPVNYAVMDSGAYEEERLFLVDLKRQWTDLLNDLDLDLVVSGHHHQLMPITTDIPAETALKYHETYWPGNTTKSIGLRTDSEFNTFIVSRRSNVQSPLTKENLFGKAFIGLAASVEFAFLDTPTITLRYTDTSGSMVPVVNPFLGGETSEFSFKGQTVRMIP
jgi:hypothetical protein